MLIDCFTLKAGEITTRKFIDTNSLEPSDLEYYQEFLQRLQSGEDSISVSGEPPDDVRLRLGLPPAEQLREELIKKDLDDEELIEFFDDYAPANDELHSSTFSLNYGKSGVFYLVVPSFQAKPLYALEGFIAGTYACEQIDSEVKKLPDENVMADMEERWDAFEDIAHEIWETRPAIVIPHSWGAEWDEFAENIGTAMLLGLENSHDEAPEV